MRPFIFFIILFVIISCDTTYYRLFSGIVVDESSDTLEGVTIGYQPMSGTTGVKSVTTNINGVFRIEEELDEMSRGVILTISKDGYQTIMITSEYKDWYKSEENQEYPRATSIRYNFGTIKLISLPPY